MTLKIEHINLRVPSIPRTQAFLSAAFPDFHERGQGYSETYGYWSHFGNDDTYLALLQADKPGQENAQLRIPAYHYDDSYRLMHIGMEVDDVEELEARLRAGGYIPDSRDDSHPYRRRVYFLDDNDIEWEFVQYLSDQAEQRNDYSI